MTHHLPLLLGADLTATLRSTYLSSLSLQSVAWMNTTAGALGGWVGEWGG